VIPLRDANPTRRTPVITLAIIAACVAAFGWQLYLLADGGDVALNEFFLDFGVVPAQVSAALAQGDILSAPMLAVITSMFLHGGWLHLGGNMLYLWIFGNNVEDTLGRGVFIGFYLAGGIAAAFAQVAINPESEIPMIGASGAIAAALGAYLVLFPRARVQSLVFLGFFYQLIAVPAVIVLVFWFVLQLIDGLGALSLAADAEGGVAFFAHIGGFVAGMILAVPFRGRARQHGRR
jgi:membrane associated rhomboid family serine protease